MADPKSITRGHISFGIAGAILGLTLGFVAAHQLYGGRYATLLAGAGHQEPERGPGMAPSSAAPPQGSGGAGMPEGGGAPDMAMMEQVKAELASLKQQLAANPKDTDAMTRLGNMYMDAGKFDQAEGYYRDALKLLPNDVGVRTDLGTCIRSQGRTDEALKEFEASVKIDPTHWRGWFNMGIVYLYDQAQYDKAREMFAKVITLNPGHFTMEQIDGEIERVRKEKAGAAGERAVMRRLLTALVWFVGAIWLLRLMGGTLGRAAAARTARATGPGRQLVRDRICDTFIPRDRALVLTTGDETHYFCSAACRARHG